MNDLLKSVTVNRVTYLFGANGLPKEIRLPAELDNADLLLDAAEWEIRDEIAELIADRCDFDFELAVDLAEEVISTGSQLWFT